MATLSEMIQTRTELENKIKLATETFNREIASLEKQVEIADAKYRAVVEGNLAPEIAEVFGKINCRGNLKTLTDNYNLYMKALSEFLVEGLANGGEKLRGYHVEIQDNSYGGDARTYTSVVQNGYSTNYHPDLFSIRFNPNMSTEDFESLLLFVERFKTSSITRIVSYETFKEESPKEVQIFLEFLEK